MFLSMDERKDKSPHSHRIPVQPYPEQYILNREGPMVPTEEKAVLFSYEHIPENCYITSFQHMRWQ